MPVSFLRYETIPSHAFPSFSDYFHPFPSVSYYFHIKWAKIYVG